LLDAAPGRVPFELQLQRRESQRFTERLSLLDRPESRMRRWRRRPHRAALLDESYACFGTEDFRIGCRAFPEKEKPEFNGR
jgi:hypothetical protein